MDSNLNINNEEIDLRDLLSGIIRKKKFLILTAGLVLSGSMIFTSYMRIFRPVYKGSFTLLISDPMNESQRGNDVGLGQSSLFQNIAMNSSTYEVDTLIELLRSPLFLNKVEKDLGLPKNFISPNLSIGQPRSKISKNKMASGILEVNILVKNRDRGKLILNKLAESYLEASFERRQQKLNSGLDFLDKQAPSIQKKTDELQSRLVEFRERYKLIEPSIEGLALKTQQQNMDQIILNLESQRNSLLNIRKEISNGTLTARGFQEQIGNGLIVSDFDQGLLQQLINIETEIAAARSKYTPDSIVIKNLKLRLNEIQPILIKNQLEATDTALNLNLGSLENAKKQKIAIEKEFIKQPELIKKYKNIEQELIIANQNLLSLEQARESFQLEMAQNSIPWRVISDPKISRNPIEPSFQKNLTIGAFLGILLGIVIALIRDKIDHVFHFPDEVKQALEEPNLGTIPYVEKFKNVRQEKSSVVEYLIFNEKENEDSSKSSDNYEMFFYQEAFRNFYTSIRFLNTDKKVKTIVLTSSLPKEGKTLINIVLAKTLTDMGLKVLLVDADMRKPQLHYRLGLNNVMGLSNYLTDTSLNLVDVIQTVDKVNNLSVITGGKTPPDPTRLLSSNRTKKMMLDLKNNDDFDMIIFDSPPVLGLADSLLISEYTDGVIIVVGLEVVDRSLPKESINKIKTSGATLLGVVTNSAVEKSPSLSNSYGYGYKYQPYTLYESYATDSSDQQENNQSIQSENENKQNKIFKIFALSSFGKTIKRKKDDLLKWLDN